MSVDSGYLLASNVAADFEEAYFWQSVCLV